MSGGGLISDADDAKSKLGEAMTTDIVYKNIIDEKKETLLSNTLKKLNEINKFDEYPVVAGKDMLSKVFVNIVLKFEKDPHQVRMAKAEADAKAKAEADAKAKAEADAKAKTEADAKAAKTAKAAYRNAIQNPYELQIYPKNPPDSDVYGNLM
jgi:hypothetical protein